MAVYLDSSALVKLIRGERESPALRVYLGSWPADQRASAALARVEVVRAVRPGGAFLVARARTLLEGLVLLHLDLGLLDRAASLDPAVLRGLDAIHLAAAEQLLPDLDALVAYDTRLLDAAAALELPTAGPA